MVFVHTDPEVLIVACWKPYVIGSTNWGCVHMWLVAVEVCGIQIPWHAGLALMSKSYSVGLLWD